MLLETGAQEQVVVLSLLFIYELDVLRLLVFSIERRLNFFQPLGLPCGSPLQGAICGGFIAQAASILH